MKFLYLLMWDHWNYISCKSYEIKALAYCKQPRRLLFHACCGFSGAILRDSRQLEYFWRFSDDAIFWLLNGARFDNFVVCYPAFFDYGEITRPETHAYSLFFLLFFFLFFSRENSLEIDWIIETTRRIERRNDFLSKTNLWEKCHMRVKLIQTVVAVSLSK